MNVVSTTRRDVRFEIQLDGIKRRLMTPATRSACSEKQRFRWTEPAKVHRPFTAEEIAWVKSRGGGQCLSVTQMARELDCHYATISRILRGKRHT